MARFTTLSAIFLTGVFTTALANLHTPPQTVTRRLDESQLDDKTREMFVTYHCFKSTLTTTLELLAHGKIRLDDARNRVHESALRYHPAYLKRIESCERGATPQERVARNLIGHVSNLAERDLIIHVRVFALEIEFADLKRQASASGPQS
jgi:hypothetical protein